MTPEPPPRWERRRHLDVLVISIVVLTLSVLLRVTPEGRVAPVGLSSLQLPPSCPSQLLWNMKCPGCGLTRAFVCLAGGDVAQAQRMHRLGVLMFLTVLLQLPYRLVALSRPGAPPLGYWFPRVFGYALIAALIGNWFLELAGYLPNELPPS